MRVLDTIRAARELAKAIHKPILYLSGFDFWRSPEENDKPWTEEGVVKAAPFLNPLKDPGGHMTQAFVDGYAYVICDSDEELHMLFDQVVGEDGPTQSNPYNGKFRVYALTVDSDGVMRNENT